MQRTMPGMRSERKIERSLLSMRLPKWIDPVPAERAFAGVFSGSFFCDLG